MGWVAPDTGARSGAPDGHLVLLAHHGPAALAALRRLLPGSLRCEAAEAVATCRPPRPALSQGQAAGQAVTAWEQKQGFQFPGMDAPGAQHRLLCMFTSEWALG